MESLPALITVYCVFFLVLNKSFDLLFLLDLCLMKKIIPLLLPLKMSDIIFS